MSALMAVRLVQLTTAVTEKQSIKCWESVFTHCNITKVFRIYAINWYYVKSRYCRAWHCVVVLKAGIRKIPNNRWRWNYPDQLFMPRLKPINWILILKYSLPVQLRNPDITYKLFRRQLKGHLFREAWTRRSVTSGMRRLRKTLTYLLTYLMITPGHVYTVDQHDFSSALMWTVSVLTHYRLRRVSDGCWYCWSVAETAELISNDSASLFSTGFVCTSQITATRSSIFVLNSRRFVFKINFMVNIIWSKIKKIYRLNFLF